MNSKNNIVEMPVLPNTICRFNTIPITIPMVLFTEIEQRILKFIWNYKEPQITKAILRGEKKAEGITLPDIKIYYKAIALKTAGYQQKNRYIDQQNQI